MGTTVRSEICCALRLRYVDLVVSIEVAIAVCCCLYSVVRQRLECNTGKVCNCLIVFLLTVVLLTEERVFISAQRLSERTVFMQVMNGLWLLGLVLSCLTEDGF
jgi:hypothetical protein